MSQWAIDGVGRSLDIFNQMKNAAERGVKLSLLFTAHDTAKMDSGFAPYDLINHQLKDGQVRLNTYQKAAFFHPKSSLFEKKKRNLKNWGEKWKKWTLGIVCFVKLGN